MSEQLSLGRREEEREKGEGGGGGRGGEGGGEGFVGRCVFCCLSMMGLPTLCLT